MFKNLLMTLAIVLATCTMTMAQSQGRLKGKITDETGEKEQARIQQSQRCTLQAPGKEDPADDQEGQAPRRADAPQATLQSVFLLVSIYINKVYDGRELKNQRKKY